MQEDTFIAVRKFMSEKLMEEEGRINLESRIEDDLEVTGDDAIEFLVAFGKKFSVDLSHFMAADYFDGEGLDLFAFFRKRKKKILTVHHLVKAVTAGKLDESVING